jgi:hypothetical protein
MTERLVDLLGALHTQRWRRSGSRARRIVWRVYLPALDPSEAASARIELTVINGTCPPPSAGT